MKPEQSIYAFVCTRSSVLSPTTNKLVSYLSSAGAQGVLLIGEESIFTAYSRAVGRLKLKSNDIVIFCHDDIEILNKIPNFLEVLSLATKPKVGFIGVAGTRTLPVTSVWWTPDNMEDRRGVVWHGKTIASPPTYFGDYGNVAVLDGVFLAASGRTLANVRLDKPPQFEGEWDFYDITYTSRAHRQGYNNFVVPIHIRHESIGELVGRDSWHKNRQVFCDNTQLPLCTKTSLTLGTLL